MRKNCYFKIRMTELPAAPSQRACCKPIWNVVSESFMDPTVRELPKSEEIVLPDIRFLTQEELDALRANAEALKKKFDQTTR